MGDLKENSRDRVLSLLRADYSREWGCRAVADELGLTVRTVSATIASLKQEGLVERAYGARRRMMFRACEPQMANFPTWMTGGSTMPPSIGSRLHLTDDGEVDIKTTNELTRTACDMLAKLRKSKRGEIVVYLDVEDRTFRYSLDKDILHTGITVVGVYAKVATSAEVVEDMQDLMDEVYG